MNHPLVLALDLSTSTGWAAGRAFEVPRHGVWSLGKSGDHGRYFSSLASCLEGALDIYKPDICIMEAPLPADARHKMAGQGRTNETTTRIMLGLAAVTEMICFERSVKCEEADVRDARQLVLGKQPRGGKQTVIDWCRGEGWNPATDDAADALCLLRYRQILGRAKITA